MLAQLAAAQQRPDEAADLLAPLLEDEATATAALRRSAGLYALQAGRGEQALAQLRRALLASPDRAVLRGLMQLWQQRDDRDDARDTLEEALAVHPGAGDLWAARLSAGNAGDGRGRPGAGALAGGDARCCAAAGDGDVRPRPRWRSRRRGCACAAVAGPATGAPGRPASCSPNRCWPTIRRPHWSAPATPSPRRPRTRAASRCAAGTVACSTASAGRARLLPTGCRCMPRRRARG